MSRSLSWLLGSVTLGLVGFLLTFLSLRWYLLYPYPLVPTIILMLLLMRSLGWSPMAYLLFLLGPTLFFLSSPSLAAGKERLSKRDFWVLAILSVLEISCLALTWRGGYKYVPGPAYTNLTIVLSLVWLVALWLIFAFARRHQSYRTKFVYHFVFVLWLLTYAFPWLGEMP